MDAVAAGASLSKGAVYLYFKTKEELFLALLRDMLGAWFTELDERLRSIDGPLNADDLIVIFTTTVSNRDALGRLLVDGGVLESTVGLEAVTEHKRWLWARLATTGAWLEARFPPLRTNEGLRLLLHLYAMLAGISQLTRTSPVVEQAMRLAGLDTQSFDFERELTTLVYSYLLGLEQRAGRPLPRGLDSAAGTRAGRPAPAARRKPK